MTNQEVHGILPDCVDIHSISSSKWIKKVTDSNGYIHRRNWGIYGRSTDYRLSYWGMGSGTFGRQSTSYA